MLKILFQWKDLLNKQKNWKSYIKPSSRYIGNCELQKIVYLRFHL